MPFTRYKIWAVGEKLGAAGGVVPSCYVGIAGIAKPNTPAMPYTVFNELISNRFANLLMLPCPPGFMIEPEGEPYFVSLNFNLSGQDLPPANPNLIIQNHQNLVWGIILFDAWIANADRHNRNISFDTVTNKLHIFDHSHALLGAGIDPCAHIKEHENSIKNLERNCLAQNVTSLRGFESQFRRLNSIPDFFISELLSSPNEIELGNDITKNLEDFLMQRRSNLAKLILGAKNLFPKIPAKAWKELEPLLLLEEMTSED